MEPIKLVLTTMLVTTLRSRIYVHLAKPPAHFKMQIKLGRIQYPWFKNNPVGN